MRQSFISFQKTAPKKQTYLNLVYEPVRNLEGDVTGILAAISDVTAQVLSKNQIEIEKNKLETILTNSPAAITLWRGKDFIYETYNSAYQALFPDRALLGRPVFEVLPEALTQGFPEILRGVLETGKPYFGREVPFVMQFKDGAAIQDEIFRSHLRARGGRRRSALRSL